MRRRDKRDKIRKESFRGERGMGKRKEWQETRILMRVLIWINMFKSNLERIGFFHFTVCSTELREIKAKDLRQE